MGTYTRLTQQRYFEWLWVILSDLAKYSMTRSVARSLCDSWATCTVHIILICIYRLQLKWGLGWMWVYYSLRMRKNRYFLLLVIWRLRWIQRPDCGAAISTIGRQRYAILDSIVTRRYNSETNRSNNCTFRTVISGENLPECQSPDNYPFLTPPPPPHAGCDDMQSLRVFVSTVS